ncbi:hypothetical protein ATK86_7132 [Nocardia fluminea]|uniref:Uncharacterized protein n=2 Tax=Nocardia fluminea TaxID=134984 RepID=A0A2N3V529_9NOCA|nr:hypothetical protein ATK86_7132 [Nocardia fluminea]
MRHGAPTIYSHIRSSMLTSMQLGDLVRLGANGVSQFRVLEVEDAHALIEPTSDAPSGFPFRMRLIDLVTWTDD